jgi:hypothetical protein
VAEAPAAATPAETAAPAATTITEKITEVSSHPEIDAECSNTPVPCSYAVAVW